MRSSLDEEYQRTGFRMYDRRLQTPWIFSLWPCSGNGRVPSNDVSVAKESYYLKRQGLEKCHFRQGHTYRVPLRLNL